VESIERDEIRKSPEDSPGHNGQMTKSGGNICSSQDSGKGAPNKMGNRQARRTGMKRGGDEQGRMGGRQDLGRKRERGSLTTGVAGRERTEAPW
jgi:hypothetical protein